jgi:hypothetical protein
MIRNCASVPFVGAIATGEVRTGKISMAMESRAYQLMPVRWFRRWQRPILSMVMCLTCDVSIAGTSRLYPPSDGETGGLRLTQIMAVATRDDILKSGESLQHLLASGLKDSDLRDGSLAIGRIYCCHPSTEQGTAIWFYVPPEVPVSRGDLVIVRMGRRATKKDLGVVNTAIQLREKKDTPNSQCSWDPPDEKMWTRVLYCAWMPAEGWKLSNGLHKTWIKPASEAQSP